MLQHKFDLMADEAEFDLFAEELPDQVQLLSDCLATLGCVVCGMSTIGTIISCGS